MVLGIRIYSGKQNRNNPCPLRASSDRSLGLENDRDRLWDPAGSWHPEGHSRDPLGNRDKSRERTSMNWVNSSRRNCFQVTPHFAYKHETMQKHSKVKPLFKIKEELISQITPSELSKHTLRINSGLLEVRFSHTLKCFISQGKKRLRLYNTHPTYITPKHDLSQIRVCSSISQKYFAKK